jgi:uncharacterized protein YwqG
MNKADVASALASAGMARITKDLDQLLAPSIRLTTTAASEGSLPTGCSKFGGLPDLPAGTLWPQGKNGALAFIAQVRLADAAPYDSAHLLPVSGLLSFFYDATQQTYGSDPGDRGGWQVFYHEGDTSRLQRLAAPASQPANARFTPCSVAFSGELTLPQQPELDVPVLDWSDAEKQQYETFLANYPSAADRATPHNRLLGHPDTIQDDMRLQCQLVSNGVTDFNDPHAASLRSGALNWRLLFQVDSDPNAGMRWGDAGMLYYWIEANALQARQFDKTWLVLQSE